MGNEGGFGLVGWSNDLVGMREVEDVEERDIVFVFVCCRMILLCLNVFFFYDVFEWSRFERRWRELERV